MNTPARTSLLSLLVVVTACSVSSCQQRPAPIEPVRVGVLNPLTGALGALGPSWEDAARLAAEQINAGGGLFDGRPLVLDFRDSQTTPAVAVAVAQAAIQEGDVALIGPATSGEVEQVIPVATQAQVPMISCCATSATISGANVANKGFFFRTTPNDDLQGRALAFLARNGFDGTQVTGLASCPQAAIVFRGDVYGSGFKSVFRSNYEGLSVVGSDQLSTVLSEQSYDTSASDTIVDNLASAVVSDLSGPNGVHAGANPELCVVFISFDSDGGKVALALDAKLKAFITTRSNSDASFTLPYHFLTADGSDSDAFANTVRGLGANIVGTVPTHASGTGFDEFKKAYTARFGVPPSSFTANVFDAVMLTGLAIAEKRSTVGADIRDGLFSVSGKDGGTRFEGKFFGEIASALLNGESVDYAGPSGELTFDAKGDVIGDYVLWRAQQNGDGTFSIAELDPLPASLFAAP
jgi:branched-chain amino acid transport system substrate-binding protein